MTIVYQADSFAEFDWDKIVKDVSNKNGELEITKGTITIESVNGRNTIYELGISQQNLSVGIIANETKETLQYVLLKQIELLLKEPIYGGITPSDTSVFTSIAYADATITELTFTEK